MTKKKINELFEVVLGKKRKEIEEYIAGNRAFLEKFLNSCKESPELYEDYEVDKLLIRLEKLQDIDIYISGVHEYSPTKEIDEEVVLRVMTKNEFIDYIIAFFGPNYEMNKEWNILYALEREFYREYREMTQYER